MKQTDKDKVKEPFDPERTPSPAQFPDPGMRTEKDQSNRKAPEAENEKSSEKKSEKLLGESETEINDETTI